MGTRTVLPKIRIRPIGPTDRVQLEHFYAGLSDASLNARFHGATRGIGERAARSFCHPDHAHREGLVAVVGRGAGDEIIGHICLEPCAVDEVEMAIAVADAFQRRGIGRGLLAAALGWATHHGIDRMRAETRWSNPAIMGLLRSMDRPVTLSPTDVGCLEAVVAVPERFPVAA